MAGRTPQQQRGIERRQALLDAAASAFDHQGYIGAPLSEIVRDAGTTLGALVFYFPRKEDLARAVIEEQRRRTDAALEDARGLPDPLAQAIRGSKALADLLVTDPMVRGGVRLCADGGPFLEPESDLHRTWAAELGARFAEARGVDALADGYDPADLGAHVAASFFGAQTASARQDHFADLDARLALLWRVTLDAAVRPEHRPRLQALARDVFAAHPPLAVD